MNPGATTRVLAAAAIALTTGLVSAVPVGATAPAPAAPTSSPTVHVTVTAVYSRNRVVSSTVTTWTTGMQSTDLTRVWIGGNEHVIVGDGSSGYGASQSGVLGAWGYCPFHGDGTPGTRFQLGYRAGTSTQTCS